MVFGGISTLFLLGLIGVSGRSLKSHAETNLFFKDPICPRTTLKAGEFPVPDIP